MHQVKTPPVVDLDEREWRLTLDSLPQSQHVQTCYEFTDENHFVAGDPGVEHIVKVSRPKEVECPEPSVVIKNWLAPGWEEVGRDPESFVKESSGSGRRAQKFSDSEERMDALEEWLERKKAWEVGARDVVDALAAFSELFELHGKFERESEKYQLFVADGVLVVDDESGPVRHPVLLQRVELNFEPAVPEFTIADSDDNPEIYTPLLRHVGVDGKAIQQVCDLVAEEHFHPLGGSSTSEFLKDFVQRFWKNGEFFETKEEAEGARGPHVYREPQLFLGNRNHGFAENIDRFLEALSSMEELPESLLRIVGIETGRGEIDDERPAVDMLLTKHANPEQERVIQQLEDTGAVLVQGPPGTGKSHTIANLIGHLLAQDKSILVTSHASKALRVVRGHLAQPLQPLCVSVLQSDEESTKQLEESVTGIVNYIASTSEKKLDAEIEKLAEKRRALKQEYDELRDTLLEAAKGEYEEIEILGTKTAPSEAARSLVRATGVHDWLPGPLQEVELSLGPDEIRELYASNETIASEDEPILDSALPDLDRLPAPKQFAELFDDLGEVGKRNQKKGRELWKHDDQRSDELEALCRRLAEAVSIFDTEEEWILDCVEAGQAGGDRRETWADLVGMIERCAEEIPELESLTLKHGPRIRSEKSAAELEKTCLEILKHLESGKRLAKLSTLLRPEWSDFLKSCQVDDGPPRTKAHFQSVLNWLQIATLRESLAHRWDRQMVPFGAPECAELGKKPEKKAARYAAQIAKALDWKEGVWTPALADMERVGLDWNRLAKKVKPKEAIHAEVHKIREVVTQHLEAVIEARVHFLEAKGLSDRRGDWLHYLDEFSRKDPIYSEVRTLKTALKKGNYDAYSESWGRIRDLTQLVDGYRRRKELLEQLGEVAPCWAEAIRERHAPHDRKEVPGPVSRAWQFRHWEQILSARSKIDLDKLQEKLHRVKEQLFVATATYVEKLSWRAQIRRTGLEQQQALNGWLGLHKKIGKGTGKNVARFKEEAKKTLALCRSAVPVWIMPLSRVVECFDLATTQFDVVILDEASQSDVLGLVAFALGKEVVVVGDHEQVSPYAVGQRAERINGLIDEILTDIPNKQLYDGKTSVYDLARQSFGGTIRLLEHFRCVPDIIQFSNQLCYGGEIRALRAASASRLKNHLVAHRVKEAEDHNGINKNEALEVASLVSAMCRLEEYENCTIGVICMVGTDQALYIDSVLRRRLSVAEYQRRQILCGNASQFQGDERDVIFLSMVNSPSDRPLTLRQREDAKKVFNVAASRARDQLWVVHSLDPRRDLKHGDLRLKLISHAENPEALRPKVGTERKKFHSELEKQIFLELTRRRYRVIQQHEVGEYVIDLVVEGQNENRVAIQCDGDRLESVEYVVEALERQFTLERLGWEFVRLRGSEFFRDPDKVVNRLVRRLQECEISPMDPDPAAEAEVEESPVAKVLKRAEMIRLRWKDIPSVSSIRPQPVAARSESGPGSGEDA